MKPAICVVFVVISLLAPFAGSSDNKPITFNLTIKGEVEDRQATSAGFHTSYFRTTHLGFKKYDVSDGEELNIYDGTFTSPEEAEKYFEWNLRSRAARVVVDRVSLLIGKRGDKTDQNQKTVGLRAEYLLKSNEKTKMWAITWTEGATFIGIYAPTLGCALEAEKPHVN